MTHLHLGGGGGTVTGVLGAGNSVGSISRPCLPRSLAPQPLRPSCPPAPPRRPSHHCRCPRCVSVLPSPAVGGGEPAVSACSASGLTVALRERDDPLLGSLQCQLCDTAEARVSGATVSPARGTGRGPGLEFRKYSLNEGVSPYIVPPTPPDSARSVYNVPPRSPPW